MKISIRDAVPAPTIPGGIQIDRKWLEEIAMGRKPDGHEEQQNWTMTMGM